MHPIVLAIDPSMLSLGWACINLNLDSFMDIDSDAWSFGVIHPCRGALPWIWQDAVHKLKRNVKWTPSHIVCEWPSYFASTRGKIAATKGYTINLAGISGYIIGQLGFPADCVTLIKPEQWKGSVPKSVTKAKFIRMYGDSAKFVSRNYSHDVIDAIMILTYWIVNHRLRK